MAVLIETYIINDFNESVPTVFATEHIVSITPIRSNDYRCIVRTDDGKAYTVDESYERILNTWKGYS